MAKGICLIIVGIVICSCVYSLHVEFQQGCEGYLKQAADANSVELALDRLDKAVKYCEDNGLTNGYTSVFWRTEDENIGFWYKNLKVCQKELTMAKGKSQLEQTNVLMKVRESLTDNGEKGTELTYPDGIEAYPNNLGIGIFCLFGFLCIGAGALIIYAES